MWASEAKLSRQKPFPTSQALPELPVHLFCRSSWWHTFYLTSHFPEGHWKWQCWVRGSTGGTPQTKFLTNFCFLLPFSFLKGSVQSSLHTSSDSPFSTPSTYGVSGWNTSPERQEETASQGTLRLQRRPGHHTEQATTRQATGTQRCIPQASTPPTHLLKVVTSTGAQHSF